MVPSSMHSGHCTNENLQRSCAWPSRWNSLATCHSPFQLLCSSSQGLSLPASILYTHLLVYCLPSPLGHKLLPVGHTPCTTWWFSWCPCPSPSYWALFKTGPGQSSQGLKGLELGCWKPSQHCTQLTALTLQSTNLHQWLILLFHSFPLLWFQVSTNTKRYQGPWKLRKEMLQAKSLHSTQYFKRKLNMHI